MAYCGRPLLSLAAVVMALGLTASLVASGAGTDMALLKKVSSRVDDRAGIISIEATEPVPYVASQPDPMSFVVEMRDVVAAGFTDGFKVDPRSPVSAVQVENARALDGAQVTRVRMSLTQPLRPRVRSVRNMIFVEADRLDRGGAAVVSSVANSVAAGAASGVGPASAIRDLRVTRQGNAIAVTLMGTGKLVASGIEETKDGPARVFIDLPNVTSALPGSTPVDQGPVERVRIGLNARSPLVTRVVMDLSRRAAYRVEPSADGRDLTVIFDEPAQDLMAAVATPARRPLATSQASPSALAGQPPSAATSTNQPPSPVASASQGTPASQGQGTMAAALQLPQAVQVAQATPPPTLAPQQAPQAQGVLIQPSTAQGTAGAPGAPRFTGFPVSLDFQGADLRAVLRTFAEISGLNVVLDSTIQGTVDVSLRDVPWDQALDIILRANKLGYIVDGTIVRVVPLTVLADEQAQRQKLNEAQALAGDLQVMTLSLSYAKADDMGKLLTTTALSQRGSIQTDPRTNTIIINDLPDRLQKARALMATLDSPQPQVEIEARIVQTTREFARTLGVQWGTNARASNSLGNTLPFAFPNQGSISGRTGQSQGPPAPDQGFDNTNTAVNLGVTGATSALGVALGSVNGAVNLDVALSALESQGKGRLLSTPRVSTQNNVEAEITQGVQIPIQTIANNTVTVTFKDAALTLKVTPQITAANTVIMRISVENASPDFSRSVNNIPPIDTQRATTQVLVSDGDTTVIGGIYVSREQASQDRTPGLYRIPLLGWLFKRDGITEENRELLIFITPRIQRL